MLQGRGLPRSWIISDAPHPATSDGELSMSNSYPTSLDSRGIFTSQSTMNISTAHRPTKPGPKYKVTMCSKDLFSYLTSIQLNGG